MRTVILITNIPTPYRIPLFNELSVQLESYGLHLKVAFASLGYSRRKWAIDMSDCEFDYTILPSRVVLNKNKENITFNYSGINKLIKEECPSAIITNEFSIATTKLWLRSYFSSIPYIIWSGAISGRHHQLPFYRMMQRRFLVNRASAYVAYGSAAKDNLISLGATSKNVHIGINTVDTQYFTDESNKWKNSIQKDATQFIYVGHLTKGKRLDLLLDAAKEIMDRGKDFRISIIGSGPEQEYLENLSVDLGINHLVNFEGYKQKDEIPKCMAQADCFVFPSEYDVWGLVLVEAMACALPCIASNLSGATRDLVINGKTGFAVDFSDTSKVAKHMMWVIDNPKESSNLGLSAKDLILSKVNTKVSAKGFVDAFVNCLENFQANN